MEKTSEDLILIEALAAYPWGTWTLYSPSGEALVEHIPSLDLAVAMAQRKREGKWVPPEESVVQWKGEGGLMIQLENGEWRKLLRLEDSGERFLTRDEVREWREIALRYGRGSNEMKQFYRRVLV